MPMIKLVYYYPDKMPSGEETLLRCATLIGAMVGQLAFGFLADIYGRRKMYGLELYVMILAIVGIVMSSSGADGSMSIFGWLFAWRFIMGIGIGGDYPLSATITAEFAPTIHRARMLATVFYMQPVGYLLATLVTLGVTRQHRANIPMDLAIATCDNSCIHAVDRSWRIIIGVGAIPAVIAIFFRRKIPESPLYTADVINQLEGAIEDMVRLNGPTPTPDSNGAAGSREMRVPPVPVIDNCHAGEVISEEMVEKFSYRLKTYWRSFKDHFFAKGFGWSLLGVSLAWLLLDTSFYALGSSSSTIVTSIFNAIPIGSNLNCTDVAGQEKTCTVMDPKHENPDAQSLYGALFANSWRSLILVCSGSLSGGFGMILLIKSHSPRLIQIWGFLLLILIFLTAGLLLLLVSGDHVTIPVTIVYFIAQLAFEMGPNFTTFILAAEIFPTRHRAFGHGIAAASGKLGAAIFQVFFQFVKFHNKGVTYGATTKGTKWLGFTVMCFIPTMIAGAAVTWLLVPETRTDGGDPLALDVLENRHGWLIAARNRRRTRPAMP
ncbi:major facilitator superfamily domain-containing protein [Leptodontidium sp. 2 PMI_412]|nr:major facilitator superfamily domain-containing protein [Leptodontidium sp. 2 PMI_412]